MATKTKPSLKEEVQSSVKEKKCSIEDSYYAKDDSWALVILTSGVQPLHEVRKSLLVVFSKENPEDTGALYNSAFQGEDFYYADSKLTKILSVEQKGKSVFAKVQKESGKKADFEFEL